MLKHSFNCWRTLSRTLALAMAPLDTEDVGILFGSQTGTAEEVAWDLAREGRRRGLCIGDPQACGEFDVASLRSLRVVIFVVATTGQGDPPINMRKFWQALCVASLPKTILAGLQFAVFGLGDSHYREFNYAARKLHARLKGLGATSFFRLGLGDDQHDFGLEQELDPWAEGIWATLPGLLGHSAVDPDSLQPALPEPRYSVELLPADDRKGADAADTNGSALASLRAVRTRTADEFEARVVLNQRLCSDAHAEEVQDIVNVRLQVPEGVSYKAGDVCTVWPLADADTVQQFIVETLGLDPDRHVRIRPARSGDASSGGSFPDEPLTLREVFTAYVDIGALPTRHFFYVLSCYTDDKRHKEKLTEFSQRSLEAKDALYEYCKREKRSAAEVMWDFWTARPPLAQLLSVLPPMRPRRYSVASGPSWHLDHERAAAFWHTYQHHCGPAWRPRLGGQAVHAALAEVLSRRGPAEGRGISMDLCVAVVKFTTRNARERKGLCSTFLQKALSGSRVLCSLEAGLLSLPPLDVPLIFVCPGTGLSPCRALVHERHLEASPRAAAAMSSFGGAQPLMRGKVQGMRFVDGAKDLMFLGFRHQQGDYLYADEWDVFKSWLSVHIAFSRDHEDRKVYVQDLIEEQGGHVCRLLDLGARILVCGRSHPMPSQVFDSFTEALRSHRGLTAEAAAARLREMQRNGRYICDTWG